MLEFLAGIATTTLAIGVLGILVALFVGYAAWKEYREGKGGDVIRSSSESAAGGIRGAFTLGRAIGFGATFLSYTVLSEFFNVGMSILDILGPVVSSNILAIVIGSLGLAGVIPMDPFWYAGVMLMIFGIAMSSAGDALFDRMSGDEE